MGCNPAQVAIKGSRAMVKVYTDLQVAVEDVQSWYSVGLEPIIGLVRPPHAHPMLKVKRCASLFLCLPVGRPLPHSFSSRNLRSMHAWYIQALYPNYKLLPLSMSDQLYQKAQEHCGLCCTLRCGLLRWVVGIGAALTGGQADEPIGSGQDAAAERELALLGPHALRLARPDRPHRQVPFSP